MVSSIRANHFSSATTVSGDDRYTRQTNEDLDIGGISNREEGWSKLMVLISDVCSVGVRSDEVHVSNSVLVRPPLLTLLRSTVT